MKLSELNTDDYEVEGSSPSLKLSDISGEVEFEDSPIKLSNLSDKDYEIEEDPNKTGKLEAAISGLGEGASLSFGDELAGLYNTLPGSDIPFEIAQDVGEALGLTETIPYREIPEGFEEPDKSFIDNYTEGRDYARRYKDKSKADQPEAYLGGQIGGGLASGIATGGMGPSSLIAKSALEGGAIGLGSSEADLTKGEIGEAVIDTAKGATIGAALPSTLKYGGKAAKKATELTGKVLKGTGKLVTGITGKVDDAMMEGASEILGVAKKKLDKETVQILKEVGLGTSGKEKMLSNITKKLDDLMPYDMKGLADQKKILKARDLLNNADPSLVKELINTGKKMGPMDLAATMTGPKGYLLKKGRDVVSSRFKLNAPEIAAKGDKIKKVANVIKESGKFATEETNKQMGGLVKAARLPATQSYIDATQGTKYERVFGEDNNKNKINHTILMGRDPEYRKLHLNQEEE